MLKRIFIILILLGLAVYLVFAITKLNKPDENQCCQGVDICLSDSTQQGFLSKADIQRMLKKKKLYPEGEKMSYIDSRKIEQTLQRNAFIEKVECFKTPTGRLHINIQRRLPIIRVISDRGGNYYLDANGKIMPHADVPAYVTVATGNITPKFAQTALTELANIIHNDPFWDSQIEQIYVESNGDIELTPRVGDQTVQLGEAELMQEKLDRLKIFYAKALSEVGWNKYSDINLKIDKQIICTKK
jgi:cell division protein FtsQ